MTDDEVKEMARGHLAGVTKKDIDPLIRIHRSALDKLLRKYDQQRTEMDALVDAIRLRQASLDRLLELKSLRST